MKNTIVMNIKGTENFPLVFRKMQTNKSFNRTNNYILTRLMSKSGQINLPARQEIYSKYFRYTKDFANTLVLLRWRWVTLLVVLVNFAFYLIFAGLWMLDAWLSGDFDSSKRENFCVGRTHGYFTGYLLLSIETITTTGYGYLYPTENCQFAWFTMTLSTIVMILIDGAFISVVFLKILKPLRKDATSMFSRKGAISLRNGKLCMIFRIDDDLSKHIIDPKINMYFVDCQKRNKDDFGLCIKEMRITVNGFLLWPNDIIHEINRKSPLWTMSATNIMTARFEIFIVISGTSLITNQFSTSQTSYMNKEIKWGYRFTSCLEFKNKYKKYIINEKEKFKLIRCDTPLCSARDLSMIKRELSKRLKQNI